MMDIIMTETTSVFHALTIAPNVQISLVSAQNVMMKPSTLQLSSTLASVFAIMGINLATLAPVRCPLTVASGSITMVAITA
jgi:hypothetical protein